MQFSQYLSRNIIVLLILETSRIIEVQNKLFDCQVSNSDCECLGDEMDTLEHYIPDGYNKAEVPRERDRHGKELPVNIYFTASIRTISPIMAAETEFRVNMKVIVKWTDRRLMVCNDSRLPKEAFDQLWLPNPYITNSKYAEIKRLDRKLVALSLTGSGFVTLTFVMNATVDCSMNLRWYPLDTQICPMHIESFSYDNSFVDYKWLPNTTFEILPTRLLQFDVDPRFHYSKSLHLKRILDRNFTRLTVYFRFNRVLGNHMIQTFVPCTLIVILSWFSFWLELDVTSARASLLMTAMLTLVMQFSGLRAYLPLVSYVKGVDVWMFGCMLFIFAAMAEFITVKVLYGVTERIRKQNTVHKIHSSNEQSETLVLYPSEFMRCYAISRSQPPSLGSCDFGALEPFYTKKRLGSVVLSGRSVATTNLPQVDLYTIFGIRIPLVWISTENDNDLGLTQSKPHVLWREIDKVSRKMFPIMFFVFSIAYWIVLIVCSSMDSI